MCRPSNGASRIRTGDPLLAKQVLYQLSYGPVSEMVGRMSDETTEEREEEKPGPSRAEVSNYFE